MVEELLHRATDPKAEGDIRKMVEEHVRALEGSRRPGDGGLVRRVEAAVNADREAAFAFEPSGLATLTVDEGRWSAGRFETPSIGELQAAMPAGGGAARLWVFAGMSPATDIGALQATTAGRPLFQVASQFNCLESPGPRVVPVANYFSDPTQGPRAAISAFPATLLRHYAAPSEDGLPFPQKTDGPQIDLLADVFEPGRSPVRNGYLCDDGGVGGEALVSALEERFERIRVGIHDEAAAVLGYAWYGAVEHDEQRRVSQSLTSTVAGGGYGAEEVLGASFEPVCRQLLRAAYLGTLLAAIIHRRSPVVLTLIGGGVFGNPLELIWESITWALDESQSQATGTLDVIVNGYNLSNGSRPATLLDDVRQRGGAVLHFNNRGLSQIER